ncbi:MAG: ABC transporter permease subunit [Candidatus Micrarchaeota archaeon]|nr:ABC transporter permease subunit [Candidatus Micrarchaeota archaeon]
MQQLLGFVLSIIIDTSFSWVRMLVALFLSIAISMFVGIYAATNRTAEKVIIPVWDIFQTLPILAFFPFVILVVVSTLPGYIGINAAVVFLIITSMVWNITFGVYESIKMLPEEFNEVGRIFNLSPSDRLTKILIPASMPRVVEQSMLSWSIGLFYLVTSEIFSTGNSVYSVKHGIGVALTNLAISGSFTEYFIGIGVFIAFVIATRLLLFNYLKRRFTRHTVQEKRNKEEANRLDIAKAIGRIGPLGKVGMGALHRNIVSIRNMFALPVVLPKRASRRSPAQKIAEHSRDYRHLLYIAAALIVIYLLYVYRGSLASLAGYEYEVLLSLGASMLRIWFAFAVIFAVALPLGVYLVFISRRSEMYLLAFQILASIPATILLPFIAISLRNAPFHNELVAFIVFFLSGIWYMVFSIVSSRSTISPAVNEVRRIFDVKGRLAWKDIYVKALLPAMITGAITGIAAEWNASIVAERFTTNVLGNGNVITSVSIGLGRLLDVSLASGNIALMVLGLINLTIVIIVVNRFFWKRLYNRVLAPYK